MAPAVAFGYGGQAGRGQLHLLSMKSKKDQGKFHAGSCGSRLRTKLRRTRQATGNKGGGQHSCKVLCLLQLNKLSTAMIMEVM